MDSINARILSVIAAEGFKTGYWHGTVVVCSLLFHVIEIDKVKKHWLLSMTVVFNVDVENTLLHSRQVGCRWKLASDLWMPQTGHCLWTHKYQSGAHRRTFYYERLASKWRGSCALITCDIFWYLFQNWPCAAWLLVVQWPIGQWGANWIMKAIQSKRSDMEKRW